MMAIDLKNKGFSYVELVFSVAILMVMALAATPYLEKTIQRKKESELRQNLIEIRSAIDAYKKASDEGKLKKTIDGSGYPSSLEVLIEGLPDITDPAKKRLRFLRRIPADPMFVIDEDQQGIEFTAAQTWGLRSYKSDADYPQEGDDVYDVYSRNPGVGLNGIPYQQW